jgi:hypothetical protein
MFVHNLTMTCVGGVIGGLTVVRYPGHYGVSGRVDWQKVRLETARQRDCYQLACMFTPLALRTENLGARVWPLQFVPESEEIMG